MDTERYYAQLLSKESDWCGLKIPTKTIQIVFTTTSFKIDNFHKTITTKAYGVQYKKTDAK